MCKLGGSESREETFKNHIRWHNIYSKNEYYMKPEKLEDLLTTEYYDVILVTLEELAEKRREANRKILKLMVLDRVYLKGVHFQGILLDVGDGHIRMYCTLTDIQHNDYTVNCSVCCGYLLIGYLYHRKSSDRE